MRRTAALHVVVCLGVLAGCAAPARTVDPGDFAARLPELERRAALVPGDAEARGLLGLALFELNRREEAEPHLAAACAADPARFETAMALGDVYASSGRPADALRAYGGARARGDEQELQLRAARERVEHEVLAADLRALAAGERSLAVADAPEGTIGVLDFSPPPAAAEMASMGKAMSAVLTTELSRLEGLRPLERKRLSVLQDELALSGGMRSVEEAYPDLAPAGETRGLQQRLALLSPAPGEPPFYTGPIDGAPGPGTRSAVEAFQRQAGLAADGVAGPRTMEAIERAIRERRVDARPVRAETAPRAGRLLGARTLLGGAFEVAGTDRLTARAQLVDVATGSARASFTSEAPVAEFYRLPGEITVRTAEALGLALTPSERKRLLSQPPPTRDLAAFLAFGRAVDLEDRGQFDEAAGAYREAVALDPGFRLARERVEVLSVDSAAFRQSVNRAVRSASTVAAAAGASPRQVVGQAAGAVGTGVEEQMTRNDASGGAERAPQAEGPPTGTVRITGQVPVKQGGGR